MEYRKIDGTGYTDALNETILVEELQDALTLVARVRANGNVKYPDDLWKRQGIEEHVRHAQAHLAEAFKSGDVHGVPAADEDGEFHIAHAACRLLFALELWQWYAQDVPK